MTLLDRRDFCDDKGATENELQKLNKWMTWSVTESLMVASLTKLFAINDVFGVANGKRQYGKFESRVIGATTRDLTVQDKKESKRKITPAISKLNTTMGSCCSCCFGEDDSKTGAKETEMASQGESSASPALSVSRSMTSPRIDVQNGDTVSGHGLALVAVVLEQDAAYWEVHIEKAEDSNDEKCDIMFGVATKKDRKFYNALEEQKEDVTSQGTDLMRSIPVSSGDIVGIAVQSDLPMVQFLLNGEPLHDKSVNRFRGNVYPSIFLPENEGTKARLVFEEREFKQISPHARFGPVIAARGLL